MEPTDYKDSHSDFRPLILKEEDLRKNTEELFSHLECDEKMRQEFIENPTAILSEKIVKRKLPEGEASDANRILFAMLANDSFRQWLDEYEGSPNGHTVTETQFSKDFAEAVLKFGDSDLIRALFKQAADGFGMPGFFKVAQQAITGPEKTVITPAATPSTSNQTAHSSSNANGVRLGINEVVNPALLRAVISQLIAHAKQLQAGGQLRI